MKTNTIILAFLLFVKSIYGQDTSLITIRDTPIVFNTDAYKFYIKDNQSKSNQLSNYPLNSPLSPDVWIDNFYLMHFQGGCYYISAKSLSAYIKQDTLCIVWNKPWWDCPSTGEARGSVVEIEINKKLYPNYKHLKEKIITISQKDIYNRVWKKNILNDSLDYLLFKRDTIIVFKPTNKNIQTTYKCDFQNSWGILNNINSEIINGYFDLYNDTLRLPNRPSSEYYTPISKEGLNIKARNLIIGSWKIDDVDGGSITITLKNDGTFILKFPSCVNNPKSNTGEWYIDNEYLYLLNLNESCTLQKFKYQIDKKLIKINLDDSNKSNIWSRINKTY